MGDQINDLYNCFNDKIKKLKINKILYIKNLLYSFLKSYMYILLLQHQKQPKQAKNVKK